MLSLALVLGLALFTRLYALGSFPNFPVAWPWLGDNPSYPGLYRDEATRLQEISLFPHYLTTYEPSIQIVAEKVSMFLFGNNNFAYRLPSGLASTITAVLVYLAARQLYKRNDAALISGLYYVAMIPALVYGRMIFYENFAALFLAATLLFIAKFENGAGRRWLYLAGLASAFAVLSKIDGLFVPVFFTLWALSKEGRKGKIGPLLLAWAPVAAGLLVILALIGSFQGLLSEWNLGYVGRELSFQFMAIQSLPSGYVVVAGGYFKPDFWYLYGYACLAALLIVGSRAGRLLMEVSLSFLVVMLAVWGMGSYYVIMMFPVIALAAGGGSRLVARVGTSGALALFTGFYIPLVASYIVSTALPTIATNYSLFFLKVGLFAVPPLVWLVGEAISRDVLKRRLSFAPIVLGCFFILLVLGTPALYSYYFLGRAP